MSKGLIKLLYNFLHSEIGQRPREAQCMVVPFMLLALIHLIIFNIIFCNYQGNFHSIKYSFPTTYNP